MNFTMAKVKCQYHRNGNVLSTAATGSMFENNTLQATYNAANIKLYIDYSFCSTNESVALTSIF